ncbi:D-methionine-binding lipoprotein metQ precursor [Serratia fonticola]|uniref:D-methionine-binding lipoprotein metQ n=1 Tax=Serratia fonticola TaxID=47917 RepID=A0A4U9WP30_SERFO|nr:D-methionine-binding lipoprotein metQ precursor [Serratia fonticola]
MLLSVLNSKWLKWHKKWQKISMAWTLSWSPSTTTCCRTKALSKGDIDVNAFQHKPYLDQQIKDRGYKLVTVGNTFVYPIAGYSKKIKIH